jgi:hypothetical protein
MEQQHFDQTTGPTSVARAAALQVPELVIDGGELAPLAGLFERQGTRERTRPVGQQLEIVIETEPLLVLEMSPFMPRHDAALVADLDLERGHPGGHCGCDQRRRDRIAVGPHPDSALGVDHGTGNFRDLEALLRQRPEEGALDLVVVTDARVLCLDRAVEVLDAAGPEI